MPAHFFHPDCQLESNKPTKNCIYLQFPVYYRMHHILSANKISECFAATKCTLSPSLSQPLSVALLTFCFPSLPRLENARYSLFAAIKGSATFTILSVGCLLIHYSYLAWPVTNTQRGGLPTRPTRGVIYKQGFNQRPHLLHATVKGGFLHCT